VKDLHSIIKSLETPSESIKTTDTTLDYIEKFASVMESQDNDILKKFAAGVRCIAEDIKHAEAHRKIAEEIVSKLIARGELDSSKIFSKIAELKEKDTREIEILNEALNHSKLGSFSLGNLSDIEFETNDYSNSKEALKTIINKVKGD